RAAGASPTELAERHRQALAETEGIPGTLDVNKVKESLLEARRRTAEWNIARGAWVCLTEGDVARLGVAETAAHWSAFLAGGGKGTGNRKHLDARRSPQLDGEVPRRQGRGVSAPGRRSAACPCGGLQAHRSIRPALRRRSDARRAPALQRADPPASGGLPRRLSRRPQG